MNFLKGNVVLLSYPFTDLTSSKVRPAIIVSSPGDKYDDMFVVPLTSKTKMLYAGEFVLSHWEAAKLNVPTAVKRGCFLIHSSMIRVSIGSLHPDDFARALSALRIWLEI